MNEPYYTYEWVMSHTWMRRGTQTSERAVSCSMLQCAAMWVVAHKPANADVRQRESCHRYGLVTYEWVKSNVWMSQVKCMNESWYTNLRMKMGDSRASVGEQSQQSRLTYPIYEACVTYEYKTCVTYKSHMELTYPVYDTCVTYGTHMKLTYPIYEKHASHTNPYIRIEDMWVPHIPYIPYIGIRMWPYIVIRMWRMFRIQGMWVSYMIH